MERMLAGLGDELEPETRKAIAADISWAKARKRGCLPYDCF
jgi:hypothetical protein